MSAIEPVKLNENGTPKDTYEHAKALVAQQTAKERAVRDKLDAIECDITGLWDDYYAIPYGSKLNIRIRNELPGNIERKLYKLIEGDVAEGTDSELNKVLAVMTMGLYEGDSHIKDTDVAFWENPANWNMRKVESVIMSYLSRLKEERQTIFSFPG